MLYNARCGTFFVKKIRISQIFKEIMLKVCYTIVDMDKYNVTIIVLYLKHFL